VLREQPKGQIQTVNVQIANKLGLQKKKYKLHINKEGNKHTTKM
jgi:hypothetical protein